MKKNEKRGVIISVLVMILGIVGLIYTPFVEKSVEVGANMYSFGIAYLILGLMLLIYFVNKDKIHSNKVFALIWFTMMLLLSSFMTARPHLISNLLLGLTIYFLLDYYDNPDSKKIYFLPLITILWANFHGGSSLV